MQNHTAPFMVVKEYLPTVINDVSQMYRTNYMGFASFTVLIWDHIDTFTAEVEYVWNDLKSPITWLFLLNRYLTPLGFIVNLFAYLSPVWTPETCSHFIRFEGAMTMIGINVVALMMLLRIYALYRSQKVVLFVMIFILVVQVSVNAWLLTKGEAVIHNPASGVQACTMIFDPDISIIASSSAWLPLLYDTVVLCLTLYRILPSIKQRNASYVVMRLFEDGLLYYSAIFATTFVLTIMIIAAPAGLKNIVAQLELLMTVTMMSRITLNLKQSVRHLGHVAEKLGATIPRPPHDLNRDIRTQDTIDDDGVIEIARPSSACSVNNTDSTGTFSGLCGRRKSDFTRSEFIEMNSMNVQSGKRSSDM